MWYYRNNSDKFEGCTLWWSQRDHWKVDSDNFIRIVPSKKNLKKSPDERLFRQEVAEDWRVSFSSDEEEASWFHFLFSFFVLTFWLHVCAFNNIRFYDDHLFARFHHHTTHSSLSSSSVSDSACDRPAREGFDRLSAWRAGTSWRAPGDPSQHRTAQQRQWAQRPGEPGDCRWHCLCSPLFSSLHSWGLVLVDGGGIYTRGLILIWVLALFSYLL